MNVDEATRTIKSTLGNEAKETFEAFVDELICYVRCLSLVDLRTPVPIVRESMRQFCHQVLVASVKTFLAQKHDSEETIRISDDMIYDDDMNPLPEMIGLRDKQEDIVGALLDASMTEFERGRKLGVSIVSRAHRFVQDTGPSGSPIEPLREVIEIEMMRLERRIKQLDEDDIKRLCSCYKSLRNKERLCAGQ